MTDGRLMRHVPMFEALPAYLGGKRKLTSVMFALLASAIPRVEWKHRVLVDPCLGGGAVSLAAKWHGFTIVSNDVARRSELIGQALIANSTVKLSLGDVHGLLAEPAKPYVRMAQEHYHPTVFTLPQARFVDRAFANARCYAGPRAALAELLVVKWLLRCFPMSTLEARDATHAALGEWDEISPRRLAHYARAGDKLSPDYLLSLAHELNGAVFPGRGQVHRGDALDFLKHASGDVLYLDPPYAGTTGYPTHYRVLDMLLGDSTSREASAPALSELLQAGRHIAVWLISYGSISASMAEVEGMCRECGYKVLRSLEIPFTHLGSLASKARNETNREYLVLAVRK